MEREAEAARLKAMRAELSRAKEDSQRDIFIFSPEGHRRIEEERRRVEEWNANVRKEWQEEKMELKWRIVAGEVVRSIQGDERADTCMEVLRVMQCTREEEALVAVAQGIIVEDSRDTLRNEMMYMDDVYD